MQILNVGVCLSEPRTFKYQPRLQHSMFYFTNLVKTYIQISIENFISDFSSKVSGVAILFASETHTDCARTSEILLYFLCRRAGVMFFTSTTPFASHHAQIVLWIQNCHFCTYSHSFCLCSLQWGRFYVYFWWEKVRERDNKTTSAHRHDSLEKLL